MYYVYSYMVSILQKPQDLIENKYLLEGWVELFCVNLLFPLWETYLKSANTFVKHFRVLNSFNM